MSKQTPFLLLDRIQQFARAITDDYSFLPLRETAARLPHARLHVADNSAVKHAMEIVQQPGIVLHNARLALPPVNLCWIELRSSPLTAGYFGGEIEDLHGALIERDAVDQNMLEITLATSFTERQLVNKVRLRGLDIPLVPAVYPLRIRVNCSVHDREPLNPELQRLMARGLAHCYEPRNDEERAFITHLARRLLPCIPDNWSEAWAKVGHSMPNGKELYIGQCGVKAIAILALLYLMGHPQFIRYEILDRTPALHSAKDRREPQPLASVALITINFIEAVISHVAKAGEGQPKFEVGEYYRRTHFAHSPMGNLFLRRGGLCGNPSLGYVGREPPGYRLISKGPRGGTPIQ